MCVIGEYNTNNHTLYSRSIARGSDSHNQWSRVVGGCIHTHARCEQFSSNNNQWQLSFDRIKRTKHNLTLATAYEVIDMDMEVEVEVDDPLLRLLMMRHLRCLTQ